MRRGKSIKSDEGSAEKTDEKTETTSTTPHPYENSIKGISTVKTVEQFWSTYNYLKRPNDLSSTTDYHFFRDGIKPTWEDPKNAKGGKWIVSVLFQILMLLFVVSLRSKIDSDYNLLIAADLHLQLDPFAKGSREPLLGGSCIGVDRWAIPRYP